MKVNWFVSLVLAAFVAAGFMACSDNPVDVTVPKDAIKVQAEPAEVTIDAPQPQNTYNYEGDTYEATQYPDGAFSPQKPNDNVIHDENGEPADYLLFNPLGAIQGAVVDGYDGFLVDGVLVYLYDPQSGQKISDTTEHGLWGFTGVNANVRWNGDELVCSGSCVGSYVLTMDLRNVSGRTYREFQHQNVTVFWDTVGDGTSESGSDPNTDTLVGFLVSGGHVLKVWQIRSVVSGSVRVSDDLTGQSASGLQLLLVQCTSWDSEGNTCGGDERVAAVTAAGADGAFQFAAVEEGLYYRLEILNKGAWEFAEEGADVDGTYYKWDSDKWFYANPGNNVPTIVPTVVVKKTVIIDKEKPYVVSVTPRDGAVLADAPTQIELLFNEDLALREPLDTIVKQDEFQLVNRIKSENGDLGQIYRNFTVTCGDCVDGPDGYPRGRRIVISLDDPDFFLEGYAYRVLFDNDKFRDTSSALVGGKYGNVRGYGAGDPGEGKDALEFVKTFGVFPPGQESDDALFFAIAAEADPPVIVAKVMPLTTDAVEAAAGDVALFFQTSDDAKKFKRCRDYGWYNAYDKNELYLSWDKPAQAVISYEYFTRADSGDEKILMVKEDGDGDAVTLDEPLADCGSLNLADAVDTLNKAKLIPFDSTVADPMSLFSAGRTFSIGVRAINALGIPGYISWIDGFGDNTPPSVAVDKGSEYAIRWDWTEGAIAGANENATDYLVEWWGDAAVDTANLTFVSGLDSTDVFGSADFKTSSYGQAIAILELSEPVLVEKVQDANVLVKANPIEITGAPRLTGDESYPTAFDDSGLGTDAKILQVAPLLKDHDGYVRPDGVGEWLEKDEQGYLTAAVGLLIDNFNLLDSGDKIPLGQLGIYDEAPGGGNKATGDVTLTVKVAPMIKRVKVEKSANTKRIYVWMSRRTACLNANGEWIDGTDKDGSGAVDADERTCDNDWDSGDAPFMPVGNLQKVIFFQEITIDNVAATGESLFTITVNQVELLSEGDLIQVRDDKLYGHDHLGRKSALTDGERRAHVLTGDDGTFMYSCAAGAPPMTAGGFICKAANADAEKKYYPELNGIKGAYMLTTANTSTQLFGGKGGLTLPEGTDEEWNGEYIVDQWGWAILAFNNMYAPDFQEANGGQWLMNAGYPMWKANTRNWFGNGGAGDGGNVFAVRVSPEDAGAPAKVQGYIDICLTDEGVTAANYKDVFNMTNWQTWSKLQVEETSGGVSRVAADLKNDQAATWTVGGYSNIAVTMNFIGATTVAGAGAPLPANALTTLNNNATCDASVDPADCNVWLKDTDYAVKAASAKPFGHSDAAKDCDPDVAAEALCLEGDQGEKAGFVGHTGACYSNGGKDCLGKCAAGTTTSADACYSDAIVVVDNACGVGVPGFETDNAGNRMLPAIRIPLTFFTGTNALKIAEAACKAVIGKDLDFATETYYCWYSAGELTVPELKDVDGNVIVGATGLTQKFHMGFGAGITTGTAASKGTFGGDTVYQYHWKY
ncbi:MAG: hypothetical protein Kow0090_13440 [Myxococcota bacterium]